MPSPGAIWPTAFRARLQRLTALLALVGLFVGLLAPTGQAFFLNIDPQDLGTGNAEQASLNLVVAICTTDGIVFRRLPGAGEQSVPEADREEPEPEPAHQGPTCWSCPDCLPHLFVAVFLPPQLTILPLPSNVVLRARRSLDLVPAKNLAWRTHRPRAPPASI